MGGRKDNTELAAAVGGFERLAQLKESPAYNEHRASLKTLFNEPRIYQVQASKPRLADFLRVVQWNIERGTRLAGIIAALNEHPVLRFADLLLLNELDVGMARSDNVDVPRALSEALSAHAVFGVEYLELTKGVGEEADLHGDNTAALHGNAILTRHPFSDATIFRLSRCEDNFAAREKRLGGRIGLTARIECGDALTAVSTHLDVVNTPSCRASQLRSLLLNLRSNGPDVPFVLGGDLNTHTFARGGALRTFRNTVRILGGDRDRLSKRLLRPHRHEPALGELERFGFEWCELNDGEPTSRSTVSGLDDVERLPWPIRPWVLSRIGPDGITLEFRLDWLAARGIQVLSEREVIDRASGVESIAPRTIPGLTHAGSPVSDHDPIVADIGFGRVPPSSRST